MMQSRRINKILATMWFTQQHKAIFHTPPTVSDVARFLDMTRMGARKLLDAACHHGYMVQIDGEYNRFGTRTRYYDTPKHIYKLYRHVCYNRAMELMNSYDNKSGEFK